MFIDGLELCGLVERCRYLNYEKVWFIGNCYFWLWHFLTRSTIWNFGYIKMRALVENTYIYVGSCGLVEIGCVHFKTCVFFEKVARPTLISNPVIIFSNCFRLFVLGIAPVRPISSWGWQENVTPHKGVQWKWIQEGPCSHLQIVCVLFIFGRQVLWLSGAVIFQV